MTTQSSPPSSSPSIGAVRARLVDAARTLLVRQGLAGCTTKEIARAAGVSEGTIYNHFSDKFDLVLAVVKESSRIGEIVDRLPKDGGRVPVRRALVDLVDAWLEAAEEVVPIFAGVIGDPELAGLHRAMDKAETDPLRSQRRVAEYLSREQEAGTIVADADPRMLARILIGTAFHHVYLRLLIGEKAAGPNRAFARSLVDTVVAIAAPKDGNTSAEPARDQVVVAGEKP